MHRSCHISVSPGGPGTMGKANGGNTMHLRQTDTWGHERAMRRVRNLLGFLGLLACFVVMILAAG